MGRRPREGLKRGAWTAIEDKILTDYVATHGPGKWGKIHKLTGLKRCGKSCRLRWLNYLKPDIKRGNISQEEEDLIIRLHKLLGNRWSLIAGRLPGRTDNEVKNYWNTILRKKVEEAANHSKREKKEQESLFTEQTSNNVSTSPNMASQAILDKNVAEEGLMQMAYDNEAYWDLIMMDLDCGGAQINFSDILHADDGFSKLCSPSSDEASRLFCEAMLEEWTGQDIMH